MTAYSAPLRLHTDTAWREEAVESPAVEGQLPRWARRTRDGKLRRVASLDGFRHLGHADVLALASAADITFPEPGTVLGANRDLARYWWMPLDGWLLVNTTGAAALTVPAGRSWVGAAGATGTISALRPGAVLVAAVPEMLGCVEHRPALAAAVRDSLVGGYV